MHHGELGFKLPGRRAARCWEFDGFVVYACNELTGLASGKASDSLWKPTSQLHWFVPQSPS